MDPIIARHFSDPGCPWAYSAGPALAKLRWRFGAQVEWRLVVIGLSETPERYESRGYTPAKMVSGWSKFERRFGMPFGVEVKSRMWSTSRACRAIVAAREQDPALAEPALRALQLMQFTSAGLLDEDEDLRGALAGVPGLDAEAAVGRIDEPALVASYEEDKARARSAEGGPTHVQGRHATSDGTVRYTAPSVIFEHPEGRTIEVGGFQPFEAYDTALANLEPGLERRAEPDDAADAIADSPGGMTTAEVAEVLRTDLGESDIAAARAQLIALSGAGAAVCIPAGADAVWRTVS